MHPDVVSVRVPRARGSVQLNESVPFIRADQVHNLGYTGAGVTIAVLDSGVDCSHPDVSGSCVDGGATFLGGQFGGGAEDDYGHGTYMAAIITAENGVAPDAKILPVKISNSDGIYETMDLVHGIDHVVRTKDAHPNLRAINLSISSFTLYDACPPCDSVDSETQAEAQAVAAAASAGIVVLACSSNEGDCGQISSPACVSSAVAVVGVYDQTIPFPGVDYGTCQDVAPQPHLVMCISNRTTIDCDQLGAPGFDIVIDQPPPGIPTWGTSQATAHASGVAALMIEKAGCPGLSPDEIAQIMDLTGTELTIAGISCPGYEVPRSIDALDAINFFSVSCSAVGHPACNADVTIMDFRIFIECMQGPGVPILPGSCTCVDYPEGRRQVADGDVDLRDFAAFQRDFTSWTDGACCHADGSCTDGPPPECFASNGLYQGNGTTCATVECPVPNWGACCQAGGSCAEDTVEDCIWGEGLYLGDGTWCASVDCPTVAYQNFVLNPSSPTYASCGSGLALADDLTLAAGSPNGLVYYDLTVYGGGVGSGTFDATVSLHTGWPPTGGNQIGDTGFTWTDLPDGPGPVHLHAVLDPPVTIPDTVWMQAEFSDQNAGWFIGGTPEIGSTQDYFGRYVPPWTLYWWQGDPYAGLWATLGCVEP
ncbi:MAG TPA: S8 family serine peptidase [Phycisphaerae bacterium]|nr:S8 family serine peptidase [Phycisphaerae bacterium]